MCVHVCEQGNNSFFPFKANCAQFNSKTLIIPQGAIFFNFFFFRATFTSASISDRPTTKHVDNKTARGGKKGEKKLVPFPVLLTTRLIHCHTAVTVQVATFQCSPCHTGTPFKRLASGYTSINALPH